MDNKTYSPKKMELADEVNEIFQRVWKRVIPDSQESPIVVDPTRRKTAAIPNGAINSENTTELALPSSEQDVTTLQAQTNQMTQELSRTEASLAPMELVEMEDNSPVTSHRKNDFPPRTAVPCLGSQNVHYEKLLQTMIRKELHNWMYYRTLARRAGGSAARVFASIASDNWQSAKRLSAAYFLISGVHFWPERGAIPPIASYLTALRDRFIEEQQDAAHYIAVATESSDPCLSELLMEIAEDSLHHAYQIRLLVEQL